MHFHTDALSASQRVGGQEGLWFSFHGPLLPLWLVQANVLFLFVFGFGFLLFWPCKKIIKFGVVKGFSFYL